MLAARHPGNSNYGNPRGEADPEVAALSPVLSHKDMDPDRGLSPQATFEGAGRFTPT
jgi:hypothetical protein